MQTVNSKKLLNSKWTATKPERKEKHFMVIAVEVDEEQIITECWIEAVLTKRQYSIDWRTLGDTELWRQGWV